MREINFYRTESGTCHVEEYLDTLSNKQVEKVFFVLQLVESLEIVPTKFFKKLESTDGLWEVRVQLSHGSQLVILNHAFTKKTKKTPQKEIKIAEQRKKDYFSRR